MNNKYLKSFPLSLHLHFVSIIVLILILLLSGKGLLCHGRYFVFIFWPIFLSTHFLHFQFNTNFICWLTVLLNHYYIHIIISTWTQFLVYYWWAGSLTYRWLGENEKLKINELVCVVHLIRILMFILWNGSFPLWMLG